MMVSDLLVYLNGEFLPSAEAKVSVFDHGLLYGDGVFEGIRVYDGVVFQLDAHLDRLFNCAKVIWLKIPLEKTEMKEAVLETLRRNRLMNAYIRLLVTRGKGDLGIDPRKCPNPSVIIIARPVDPIHGTTAQHEGISTVIASIRRQPPDSTSHEIKSLNYLNSVLARIEAISHGVDEAIILDHRGFVAEASVTTIFIIREGKVLVPPLSASILDSITRRFVMNLARELGYSVIESDVTVFQLRTADEVFLCGSLGEIIPVNSINYQPVGSGTPGLITRTLIEAFLQRREDPRYGTAVRPDKSAINSKRS